MNWCELVCMLTAPLAGLLAGFLPIHGPLPHAYLDWMSMPCMNESAHYFGRRIIATNANVWLAQAYSWMIFSCDFTSPGILWMIFSWTSCMETFWALMISIKSHSYFDGLVQERHNSGECISDGVHLSYTNHRFVLCYHSWAVLRPAKYDCYMTHISSVLITL